MKLELILYGEPSAPTLRLSELAAHISQLAPGLKLTVYDDFFSIYAADQLDFLARSLALARVKNPQAPLDFRLPPPDPTQHRANQPPKRPNQLPSPIELDFEKRNILNSRTRKAGILYDGHAVAEIAESLLPRTLLRTDKTIVICTVLLLGTFEPSDRRYHARTIVCSQVKLISLTGLVLAPARPVEFYIARQAYRLAGRYEMEAKLEADLGDSILHRDDERLTEVVEGYVLQALAHQTLGYPFCSNPACRLFNAHRQSEMLRAQLRGLLCAEHTAWLRSLGRT